MKIDEMAQTLIHEDDDNKIEILVAEGDQSTNIFKSMLPCFFFQNHASKGWRKRSVTPKKLRVIKALVCHRRLLVGKESWLADSLHQTFEESQTPDSLHRDPCVEAAERKPAEKEFRL